MSLMDVTEASDRLIEASASDAFRETMIDN